MFAVMSSAEGFSSIFHTPHYAVVSNVCINLKNNALTLHLRDEKELSAILSTYKRKDFFCSQERHGSFLDNYVRVLKTPLHPSKVAETPLHLVLAHPPSLSNRYQFTEGVSMLSYVATHLAEFPPVCSVIHRHP